MSAAAPTPKPGDEQFRKRAPTLYVIIAVKLLKGASFIALSCALYALSDNDLPDELKRLLVFLHLNPERRFWSDLATQVAKLTEPSMVRLAIGTFIYSLFSLVEGTGMLLRAGWAGWLAIGESAFFIPIEIWDLVHNGFNWTVLSILAFNIFLVWYLFENRQRLFHHHHFHHRHPPPAL